jgi:hypothetical protein
VASSSDHLRISPLIVDILSPLIRPTISSSNDQHISAVEVQGRASDIGCGCSCDFRVIEDDLPRWIYSREVASFEFISMTIQSNLRGLLAALEL